MISLATIADYGSRYDYNLNADDEDRITTLLSDASAFVCDVAGIDWTVIDPDDHSVSLGVVPVMVVVVVCEAARRAFENPAGLQSETMGDYTWRGGSSAGIFLTQEERAIVRRAAGKLGVGSVTMTTDLPAPATDPGWAGSSAVIDEDGFS